MEKLTSKDKQIVNVGKHTRTNHQGGSNKKSSKIICIQNKKLRDTKKQLYVKYSRTSNYEERRVQMQGI